jgi:hypothetical protein
MFKVVRALAGAYLQTIAANLLAQRTNPVSNLQSWIQSYPFYRVRAIRRQSIVQSQPIFGPWPADEEGI